MKKIMKKLTVGELKEALKDVSDDVEIELMSDTGVDQCEDSDYAVIVEEAYMGNNEFVIYANYRKEEEVR